MEKPPCPSCGNRFDHTENCVAFLKLQIEAMKKEREDGREVPRYAECHHFQVVMSDACPWCIKNKLDETNRLNGELVEALKAFLATAGNGFETRHAAENTYCPDCANESDDWRDQTEHHAGCQYLKRIEDAKAAIEKTAPLKRISPVPKLDGPEPTLSPEDQAALDAIKCQRCGLPGLRCVFCTPASSSTCGH